LGVKPETTGGFYREEAVRLASDAARAPQQPAKAEQPAPVYVPPILAVEPARGPLVPELPSNQNAAADLRRSQYEAELERPRRSVGRVLALIVMLPLYLVVGALSIGIIALFVKDLLGL
jgi:hypothetical protein